MCSLRLLLSRRFRWIDGASVRSSTRRGRCQGPPVAPVIGGSALQGKLLICKALRDWLQTRSAAHRSFAILRLAGSRPPPLAWAWSAPSLVAPSPQPRRFPARQPVLHRSSAGGAFDRDAAVVEVHFAAGPGGHLVLLPPIRPAFHRPLPVFCAAQAVLDLRDEHVGWSAARSHTSIVASCPP
jgi:hypothetical protein